MHDLLFANQARLDERMLHTLLENLGLASSDLQRAKYLKAAKKRIDSDFSGGVLSGVNGTPTFFLNGERYDGPTDYESLVALMEQVLISDGE